MILKAKNGFTLVYDDNGVDKVLTYDDTPRNKYIIDNMVVGEDYEVKTTRSKVKIKEPKNLKPDTFLEVEGGYKKCVVTKAGIFVSGYVLSWVPRDCHIISKTQAEGMTII